MTRPAFVDLTSPGSQGLHQSGLITPWMHSPIARMQYGCCEARTPDVSRVQKPRLTPQVPHLQRVIVVLRKYLSRIALALRSFFAILFGKGLPADIAQHFGFVSRSEVKPAAAPKPAAAEVRASDGALQMLAILQRDARLIDFLMEDISGYADDQVGAAVRSLHEQSRASLTRYVTLR